MTGELIKLLAVCLIATAAAVILRTSAAEYSFLISVAVGFFVLTVTVKQITSPIKEIFEKIASYGVKTEYFKVALKAIGIAYITDFIADSCRDGGQTSIASKAELAGKTAVFLLSVPLVTDVLEAALGFISK